MGNYEVSKGTILAVDDSPTVRKLVSITLERHNYRVLSAVDGMGALSKLNDELPDLILLDITMPRMDGYQLCKIIKDNPNTAHIPVVMLSGNDGIFDKMRGRIAGATAYLTKPFNPDKLLNIVEKLSSRIKRKKTDWNPDKASHNKTTQQQDSAESREVPDEPTDAKVDEQKTSKTDSKAERVGDTQNSIPIKTICPKCRTIYKNIKPEHIGMFVRCPKCGMKFCIKQFSS